MTDLVALNTKLESILLYSKFACQQENIREAIASLVLATQIPIDWNLR